MKYLVQHNYIRTQPKFLDRRFGSRNEGFIIESDLSDPLAAFEEWNMKQKPGLRLNPFTLTIKSH